MGDRREIEGIKGGFRESNLIRGVVHYAERGITYCGLVALDTDPLEDDPEADCAYCLTEWESPTETIGR